MITKFDSLFAGHVDIENVGYGGIPVNDRRYEQSGSVSQSTDWKASLEWAQEARSAMSRRAYSFFIATECVSHAEERRWDSGYL